MDQGHAENALTEMIREAKILMSISPHPHLNTIYGITSKGIDSLLDSGPNGYFFITDRIAETLEDRQDSWRRHSGSEPSITERLDTALDIASALVYLHDRKLAYYVRPDKVGFAARHGQIKLCDFGQAIQHGLPDHPRGITQSDNIRVLAYTAPEVFSSSPVHLGSDVYAFGVMLWELVTLESAFDGFTRPSHFQHVVRSNQMPLEVDESWDNKIAEAMKSCWHHHRRPKMKKLRLVLETALLMNDIREPNRRNNPTRHASKETVSLSELEGNAPAPCSEESGPKEHLEIEELLLHAKVSKGHARSTGPDSSKTVQSRQSRSSKRSNSSRVLNDSNERRGSRVAASALLASAHDGKTDVSHAATNFESSGTSFTTDASEPDTNAWQKEEGLESVLLLGQSKSESDVLHSTNNFETGLLQGWERASKPELHVSPRRAKPKTKLGRSASCSSVFIEAEPVHSLHRRASLSHSQRSHRRSKSPHRSKPPDRSRRTPKASKSMPELQSSEKKKRSSSKSAPRRSSSGRDRHHKPRTPSSRSNSRSPGSRKSPCERSSTPKHRRSSSGKHHGHRDSSRSPSDPSEKSKKHHHRKRSSSRSKREPKKQTISREEFEQFLFSSSAGRPTTPGGTGKRPKILVKKPSVNQPKVSRQKSGQEECTAFPSSAEFFFDLPSKEDPFATLPLGEANPSSETPVSTLSSDQAGRVRSAPLRTTSDQSDVRSRPR